MATKTVSQTLGENAAKAAVYGAGGAALGAMTHRAVTTGPGPVAMQAGTAIGAALAGGSTMGGAVAAGGAVVAAKVAVVGAAAAAAAPVVLAGAAIVGGILLIKKAFD